VITWAQRYRVAPVNSGGLAWATISADLLRLAIHAFIMVLLIVGAARRPEGGWARVFQGYGRLALGVMSVAAAAATVEFLRHGNSLYIGGLLGWMGLSKVAHLWSALLYLALGLLLLIAFPGLRAAMRAPSLAVPGSDMLLLLLATAGLALPFALHTGFKDERYVLPLLPMTALVWLKVSNWRRSVQLPAVALMVVACIGSCMIVRAHYNAAALQWAESDRLVAAGVAPQSIRSSLGWEAWNTWDFCFDREARGVLGREHYFPCWTVRDVPQWRIKMTKVLGMRLGREDPGFREVRKRHFATFGLPGEITFFRPEDTPPLPDRPTPAGP
jgi:hypothetical protein